eukprot:1158067-Pelagomonas_calceolata.AAC.6
MKVQPLSGDCPDAGKRAPAADCSTIRAADWRRAVWVQTSASTLNRACAHLCGASQESSCPACAVKMLLGELRTCKAQKTLLNKTFCGVRQAQHTPDEGQARRATCQNIVSHGTAFHSAQ